MVVRGMLRAMDLDHIVLAVSELDVSVRYYDVLFPLLGFTKRREHVYVNAEGVAIHVRQAKNPSHGYEQAGVGLNHLAVAASSRSEVDEVGRRMKEAGFAVPDVRTNEGGYALFMKDRDGLRVEVGHEA
jgi:catechol-2,3-dioxygenase